MNTIREPLELNIDKSLLSPDKKVWAGNTSHIYASKGLALALREIFGRDNLCLKVNVKHPIKDKSELTSRYWGRFYNSAIINNIFAMYGIAPRVYGWVTLNGSSIALVVEHLKKGQTRNGSRARRELIFPVKKILRDYPITSASPHGQFDWRTKNFLSGHYVDYSGFRLDGDAYKQHLLKLICDGKPKCVQYQPVPELGISGWRNPERRIGPLRLNEIDFKGKTVLDLGCHLGRFMREAYDRGASRCIGVDIARTEVAHELNNWLGYWNFDFYGFQLWQGLSNVSNFSGVDKFDIVFAFSIFSHTKGYSSQLGERVNEVLLVEGHREDTRETYEADLQRDFQEVEFLGYSTDQGNRPLFRCWKEGKE